MQFGGGSSGAGGSGGAGDQDENQRRKQRYHRHTAHQIQKLEAMFKECHHPDEKQRLMLSRELGLDPRQIKFWFQNRRTQMKAQIERADNSALRAENDRIRCENIMIRGALKKVICPSCGSPPTGDESYIEEQQLRAENAHLKNELDRISSIAAKYIGRPISQLPLIQPLQSSPLDLTMAGFSSHDIGVPSLDLDLLHGGSSAIPSIPFQSLAFSDIDRSIMVDIAAAALGEFLRLVQDDEPLWSKSPNNGKDILNLECYDRMFPRAGSHMKNPNVRVEASRESRVIAMNGLALVELLMDSNEWVNLFPTIIAMAKTIEVISSGTLARWNGPLQLMFGELQVLSPLLPTREFYFLRHCKRVEPGLLAIVDVSYDLSRFDQFSSQSHSVKLPSGCLIQDLPSGYSKVTWVEHVEIEDRVAVHHLYRDLVYDELAFSAERWISSLEGSCERIACMMTTSSPSTDSGVIPSPEGKRSMMKLAQRMVTNFCGSIGTSPNMQQQWTTPPSLDEVGVRVALRRATDPGHPNSAVLSAATTIWLPIAPMNVFNFFKDERTRPQWDVLSNGSAVEEIAHIGIGNHPGNCISVLRALCASQQNMIILQESRVDSTESFVVYCPVDLPAINRAMNGEDPSYIPLLPSGFTISPDGRPCDRGDGASSSSSSTALRSGSTMERSSGSLVTVSFQIMVSGPQSARLSIDSVSTINSLISTTVHQIKSALIGHG
ncbi:hypothetical protein MLD38_040077 [Melastoma candidum]|uniref:Uncharacterized protein n=1 Tax=Melastoma candidum TaxID=119954 RepID=A0ACB9L4W4_9MYRT|nr:hypothetical protein MLD38_040077 [Melastoma candidum]